MIIGVHMVRSWSTLALAPSSGLESKEEEKLSKDSSGTGKRGVLAKVPSCTYRMNVYMLSHIFVFLFFAFFFISFLWRILVS